MSKFPTIPGPRLDPASRPIVGRIKIIGGHRSARAEWTEAVPGPGNVVTLQKCVAFGPKAEEMIEYETQRLMAEFKKRYGL